MPTDERRRKREVAKSSRSGSSPEMKPDAMKARRHGRTGGSSGIGRDGGRTIDSRRREVPARGPNTGSRPGVRRARSASGLAGGDTKTGRRRLERIRRRRSADPDYPQYGVRKAPVSD